MKRFNLILATLLALAVSSCSGRGVKIIGVDLPREEIRMATTFQAAPGTMDIASAGDAVYFRGTFVPGWSPVHWDTLGYAGTLGSDGRLSAEYPFFAVAMGDTHTFQAFVQHNGRLLPLYGSWTVKGIPITARSYNETGFSYQFVLKRDPSNSVVVDPIRDDSNRIVQRTIRLTGVSSSNPSIPAQTVSQDVQMVFSSSYSLLQPMPAVWRNGAWEIDVEVWKDSKFWVRPMNATTAALCVPGCYGLNAAGAQVEFKNIIAQAPNWYYFQVGVDATGNLYNLRAADERGEMIGIR